MSETNSDIQNEEMQNTNDNIDNEKRIIKAKMHMKNN